MAFRCFRKEDSNPPMCGLHNVPLQQAHGSQELNPIGLGRIMFYFFPESGSVLDGATLAPGDRETAE
jgi:hypothetical protein